MRKPNRAAKGNGIQAPASIALNAVVLEQRVPTEVRRERARLARVSKEPHSGPAPPQLLNKSEAEKHHKANDRSFLSSFIVAHDVAPLPQQRLLLLAFVLRKVSRHCSICGVPVKSSI
jgi:hypothetical protein